MAIRHSAKTQSPTTSCRIWRRKVRCCTLWPTRFSTPFFFFLLRHRAEAVTDLTTDLSVLDLQLLNIVTEQRLFHSKLKAHRQSESPRHDTTRLGLFVHTALSSAVVDHTHETVLMWRTVMCVSVAVATLLQMWHVRRLFEQKMQQLQKQPPTSGANAASASTSSAASSSSSSSSNDAGSSTSTAAAAGGGAGSATSTNASGHQTPQR